jgi:hypothetical protein
MDKSTLFLAMSMMATMPAFAADPGNVVQRDVNQQQRIQDGLKSGQLTTKEAAQLERGERKIDRMESKALSDGKLTKDEQQRIERAENQQSKQIYRDKHNAKMGDPNSASSQGMQADIQRNVNQQARIEQGIRSGELTNHEVGKLERGQAKVDGAEARAATNGHVSQAEQQHVQAAEDHQSKRIYRKKHNEHVRE